MTCLAVYLATSQPLPAGSRDPLAVEPAAAETAARLRKHLAPPHLYFVASHEGCGCGFVLDHGEGTDEDCAQRQASALALEELAREAARLGPAELLVCLDGLEDLAPEHTRRLLPDDRLEVRLGDRVLYRILR